MQSLGESNTQPRTPCSASGEWGGNRSNLAALAGGAFLRGVRFKSGGALASAETESIMVPPNEIVLYGARRSY
jgi:hypothetical protein